MVSHVRRLHLFEFNEISRFPAVWRDLVTDFLSYFFRSFGLYDRAAPVLAHGLDRAGTDRVVDLCSGAGAPVVSLLPSIDALRERRMSITLTDLYPNVEAFRVVVASGGGAVDCVEEPVDATDVPSHLTGFRTLFTAFHHFPPQEARRVLGDATRKREGIAIFEFTERNPWLWTIPVLLIPLLVAVCTPWIRPFSWRRLLWTYIVPVVPLVAMWDGLVSTLRTYSPSELLDLAAMDGEADYQWRAGRVPSLGLSRVTYLIGWPGADSR